MMVATEATERKTAFSAMLDKAINESPKQQNEIASAIGYVNANIMTMFKRGMTRIPLDKVVKLAKTLDADPALWVKMWFEAYMPGCLEEIEPYIGFPTTAVERGWVRGLRKTYGRTIPAFDRDLLKGAPKA